MPTAVRGPVLLLKSLRVLFRSAFLLISVGIILVTLTLLGAQLQGYRVMYVVSDSMVPTFAKGTAIVVDTQEKTLAPGTIVAFHAPWHGDDVVVHRIVELRDESATMVTKGDANGSPDTPTLVTDSIGPVTFFVPGAGNFLSPPFLIGVGVLALLSYGGAELFQWLLRRRLRSVT